MIRRLSFRFAYLRGKPRWDSGITPPEVVEAFASGNIPAGPMLDLGCGTGTNTLYAAQQGRQAIGIDFAPEAIRIARRKASKAGVSERVRLIVGDVTQLNRYELPQCAFALDEGCLHSLDPKARQRYADGLAPVIMPGGWYMLYFMHPSPDGKSNFGMSPEQVEALFAPHFQITRVEHGSFRKRASSWMWMTRK